jgi:ABC-type dipeptide/oligopeptide/nickel transport system permease subunit
MVRFIAGVLLGGCAGLSLGALLGYVCGPYVDEVLDRVTPQAEAKKE